MRSRYFFGGGGIVLFLVLSLTIMISTAYAPSATVHGIAWDDVDGDGVRDPAEAVIPGPSMKLIGTYNYGPINRLGDGSYSFTVTPGSYTLRCSASGFVTQNRSISLVNDETETQNFGMRRLQGGSAASLEDDNARTPKLSENAIQMLVDVKGQILSLDPAVFKTPDRQDALAKQYETVIRNIQAGRYDLALRKLQYGILMRINGCNRLGRADENDWITDCEAQRLIYDSTEEVRVLITTFDSN